MENTTPHHPSKVLYSVEWKIEQNPELKQSYLAFMGKHKALDFMEFLLINEYHVIIGQIL